jgi:glyoxylase-like metal-dependent hydrolase (beta-lactamase superfamily II)
VPHEERPEGPARPTPFPDIVRIPTRVPFRVPPANVYLFLGAEPTLVDAACGTEEGWADLVAGIEGTGLKVADIRRILITHHHVDHAGNAARIQAASGAEVCVHAGDAAAVRQWREGADERNTAYAAGLERAAVPQGILAKIKRAGGAVDSFMPSTRVDRMLHEGDTLRAGDRTLRVIHTPGHTAGCAVYHDTVEPLAATGDTLLERITPNALTVRAEEAGALQTYLATLARLRGMDLGTILPGHGLPFSDAPGVIDRAFAHYEKRRGRILDVLRRHSEGATVWDVVVALWPEHEKGSAFLMVSEALGHLELLVSEAEARVDERDGRALYRAAA